MKEKISETQRKVISKMKSGLRLYKNVTYVIMPYGKMGTISTATFFALHKRGLIKILEKKSDIGWECILTKRGRQIIL